MTDEQAEPTPPTSDPSGNQPGAGAGSQPGTGNVPGADGPPGGSPTGAASTGIRHLRRRTSDRVIGGVAGGLGDYLNVDPILIRVAFAGLMIFGGAGIALYVLGWLLIPDTGHRDSIAQTALQTMAHRTGRLGMLVLIVAVVVIISPWLSRRFEVLYFPTEVFWALAIALIGVVLLLPREGTDRSSSGSMAAGDWYRPSRPDGSAAPAGVDAPSGSAGEGSAPVSMAGSVAAPTTQTAPSWATRGDAARPARAPRDHSPLGWYGIATALMVVGILALIDTMSSAHVLPGQYFGGALLAVGLALVVGAWRGRARLLILVGLAVLPVASVAAFLTVPLEGGVGETAYQPQTPSEVQGAYHLVAGELWIDLTSLEAGPDPVVVRATVGIGEIFVLVPRDAVVDVSGTVQGGRIRLFGRGHVGTALADHVESTGPEPGARGTSLTLILDAGIGQVRVERATVGGY